MRRVVAVDWSGDAHLARRHIWLAEATQPDLLTRLEGGRDRHELTEYLISLRTPVDAIGLDFAFAFPAWFMAHVGAQSGPELWEQVAEHGEAWLAACEPPFWGRPGRARPTHPDRPRLRHTELAVPRQAGIAPKSVFQIGGSGAVGTSSIRGMPLLYRLHLAGATIWPFTEGGWPRVVEIYPRLLTGPVRKSDPAARRALLKTRYPRLATEHVDLATVSDDAFDAAVSALVMVEHADELASLPVEPNPRLRLEGRIWHPGWREDANYHGVEGSR